MLFAVLERRDPLSFFKGLNKMCIGAKTDLPADLVYIEL